MRNTIVIILLLALMQPMLTHSTLDDASLSPQLTTAGSVDVIEEIEPNNVNTSGQEVYPGDVCLLYTSPSPRDATLSRMPSSA